MDGFRAFAEIGAGQGFPATRSSHGRSYTALAAATFHRPKIFLLLTLLYPVSPHTAGTNLIDVGAILSYMVLQDVVDSIDDAHESIWPRGCLVPFEEDQPCSNSAENGGAEHFTKR